MARPADQNVTSTIDLTLRRRGRLMTQVDAITGNTLALAGAILVTVVVIVAIVGLFWTPYPPDQIDLTERFSSPSWSHIMGTDEFGRDVLSRVIAGAHVSLEISAVAVLGGLLVGGTAAVLTGYLGGVIDLVFTRVIDILLAIPALVMALGIVAIIGPSGTSVAIALAAAYSPTFARVIRSSVVGTRHQQYVEASQGLGASATAVVRKDVMPNIMPVVIVQATAALAWGILDEANLGFLGLGVQPPTPSWGSILIEGRQYFFQAPWIAIGAGIAVVIAVLGFNLLGDGLRDLLDPRSWKRR
jgi:peptide/nickel transport system permease protein